MEPKPIIVTQGVCMNQSTTQTQENTIQVNCTMCGKSFHMVEYFVLHGAHTVCVECEDKLEDVKHETLATD